MSGHTCLAVPVPALEDWVRERTAHYDPSFVSTDPGFAHAHLTLLAPPGPSRRTSPTGGGTPTRPRT